MLVLVFIIILPILKNQSCKPTRRRAWETTTLSFMENDLDTAKKFKAIDD